MCVCVVPCYAGAGFNRERVRGGEVPHGVTLRCKKAVGGRGGSAVEIIPGFCPKPCARWADQGLREEWCYPVAVTQPRAFHLTSLAALQACRPGDSALNFHQKLLNSYSYKSGLTDFELAFGVTVS